MSAAFSSLGFAAAVMVSAAFQASNLPGAELKPATAAAFDRYVQATQARIDRELARPGGFLYIEGLAPARRDEVLHNLREGGIYIERLETRRCEELSGKDRCPLRSGLDFTQFLGAGRVLAE